MVDILLATYNGEKYVSEQIESLLSQTNQSFKIIIRDDGSTDATREIINRYAKDNPDKITIIEDDLQCGSAQKNFFRLLSISTSEYVMFCDQDDIWESDKVDETLNEIKLREDENGRDTPILVFSKYRIVDENLNELYENKINAKRLAKRLKLNRLLVENCISGCLMMINRNLADMIIGDAPDILMHDWWIALVAACFGKIYFVDKYTMRYRQHSNNVCGAISTNKLSYIISKIKSPETKTNKKFIDNQVAYFYEVYKDRIPNANRELIELYLSIINTKSKLKRIHKLRKGKFYKSTFVRMLSQFIYI